MALVRLQPVELDCRITEGPEFRATASPPAARRPQLIPGTASWYADSTSLTGPGNRRRLSFYYYSVAPMEVVVFIIFAAALGIFIWAWITRQK